MRRAVLTGLAAFVLLQAAALVLAATVLGSAEGGASSGTCTYEQKQVRIAAVADFKSKMIATRRAYFRTHKSKAQRATFVRMQQQRLRRLQATAACSVPALPPSSSASCSPRLTPKAGGVLSEGAIDQALRQPATGRIESVGLFLDYPDAQGALTAPATLARSYTPEAAWWQEVSNGRLSVSITPDTRWIRMPSPTTAYLPLNSNESVYRYVRDAIAAADPVIDFSRYNHVSFWNAPGMPITTGSAFILREGQAPPIVADGKLIRFGVFLGPDVVGRVPNIWTHEQLHVLGLPDLGGRAVGWDTTSYGNDPPGLSHLLGWHKWQLRWIDPPQLTCLVSRHDRGDHHPDCSSRRQEARRRPYQRHICLHGRGASAHRLRQERVRGGSPRVRDRLHTRRVRGSRYSEGAAAVWERDSGSISYRSGARRPVRQG